MIISFRTYLHIKIGGYPINIYKKSKYAEVFGSIRWILFIAWKFSHNATH